MKKILFNEGCINDINEFLKLFKSDNFLSITSPKDGQIILEKIEKMRPDIVVCDAFLPGKDAISIMKAVKDKNINTKFVLILNSSNEFLENELIKNGASYYFIKPFDFNTLSMIIKDLTNTSSLNYRSNGRYRSIVEEDISSILHEIGIPANIKGYHYLRYAIILCVKNPQTINNITRGLYPDIAQKFNSTPSRVERAMRHSIEIAWQRGDIDVIDSYFKNTINFNKGKPSNSEFIAMISEAVKIKQGKKLLKYKF